MTIDAYLSLGSNLGDSQRLLENAVTGLAAYGAVLAVSPIIRTKPMYYPHQPDFLNMAVMLATPLAPHDLLTGVQSLETQAGRVREAGAPRYGARPLDIDIIYYGDQCVTTETLTIPHPLRLERAFVLEPLCAIAPDFIDPLELIPIKSLLKQT